MTTMPREPDPIRRSITAAMQRLLTGTPERSTGRLSVAQLAVEAGVQRWHLTHQHTDLKDEFQARVRELEAARGAHARSADAHAALQREHKELRRRCAGLEEQLRVYATALNLLTLENAALSGLQNGARILPFRRQHARPTT